MNLNVLTTRIYIVLNKTVFGFELKAVGQNRNASKACGINEKKSILLSMIIAGGLAGIAGSMSYLAGTTTYQLLKVLVQFRLLKMEQ